jgi:hypothetical protein
MVLAAFPALDWFIISVLAPAATSTSFMFSFGAGATEWVFFIGEIVARSSITYIQRMNPRDNVGAGSIFSLHALALSLTEFTVHAHSR